MLSLPIFHPHVPLILQYQLITESYLLDTFFASIGTDTKVSTHKMVYISLPKANTSSPEKCAAV
jgi:hypothetical protein